MDPSWHEKCTIRCIGQLGLTHLIIIYTAKYLFKRFLVYKNIFYKIYIILNKDYLNVIWHLRQ
jgi:hypothetical protein